MMDVAVFRALLTPAGQEVLRVAEQLASREEDFLRDFDALRRRFPAGLARAALEIAITRRAAARKFSNPQALYFTPQALEQASPEAVSRYRSQRYRPFEWIADLGCSVGGDTLAFAQVAPTLGLDLDSLRLAMAQANTAGREAFFVLGDLQSPLPLPALPSVALFFDPARRAAHRRLFSVNDYSPPLSVIRGWLPRFPALGVKISPGVDLAELGGYDCEVEFISLNGELKEAALWFGPLKTAHRRATLLPGPHTLTDRDVGEMPQLPLSDPRFFIYEPDAAVLRAGLVTVLGEMLDASQLDADIAYLTSEKQLPTPFARVWAVEDWLPFHLKKLRAWLRQHGVGRVVVKKRGSPLTPDELIHALRLSGEGEERTLFLTHLRGKPIVVVGKPVGEASPSACL